jgi:hypothetical protein
LRFRQPVEIDEFVADVGDKCGDIGLVGDAHRESKREGPVGPRPLRYPGTGLHIPMISVRIRLTSLEGYAFARQGALSGKIDVSVRIATLVVV